MTSIAAAKQSPRSDLIVLAALVGVLSVMVLPLPAILMDLLLAFSLCVAVLTFLVAIYIEKPLEFSSFPSVLLFVTLFRLALNVASTRLILSNGDQGPDAAGGVIKAFGTFVVGGNYVVGAVVFLILVIVNFIVITKGAERISEVGARFTLDSMPGKQMAIDADLGAGLITEAQARQRRRAIEREAEFHGAMDGASKFVRGDAIAGILIVGINIIGGIVIGVAQRELSFGDAAASYTILSIGDGLVSQIPALLVSTGAALLMTRNSDAGLGQSLTSQLLSRRRPLAVAAGVLGTIGLIPGMPHFAFFALAALAGFGASRATRISLVPTDDGARPESRTDGSAEAPEAQRVEIEELLPLDLLSLEVGLDLLPMVDADRGGELLSRIASLRKQIATDLGVVVPPVHVRDDLRMRPGAYRVLISGVPVADGEVRVGRMLAIDPGGDGTRGIQGETVREPTFGLPAKWIAANERARAEAGGCTVVDASAVVATHITEVIRRNASDLLGRREAQELIDVAAKKNSKVVEELIPHLLSLGDVIKVLRLLLSENVSIRDLRSILEALADHAGQTKEPGELTEFVRQRLARRITKDNLADSGELRALVLDPTTADLFRDDGRTKDPRALSRVAANLEAKTRSLIERDEPPVIVVEPDIRRAVAAVAGRHVPGLIVMSYREVDPSVPFVTRGVISAQENAA